MLLLVGLKRLWATLIPLAKGSIFDNMERSLVTCYCWPNNKKHVKKPRLNSNGEFNGGTTANPTAAA